MQMAAHTDCHNVVFSGFLKALPVLGRTAGKLKNTQREMLRRLRLTIECDMLFRDLAL
jgi:hypothetical protein